MRGEMRRRDALRALAGAAAATGLTGGAPGPEAARGEGDPRGPERDGAERRPWYRRCLVGIEWGPTGANDKDRIYMARARGAEIIRRIVQARAEYAVVFMKDMNFAYYDSRVARKCPNLGGRDLLRESIDAAAESGIPVVAYCQIQYDTATWNAHPEWRMKDARGRDLGSRLCYRSGYLDFVKRIAAEMMEYEIAGFHFDMLDFGFGPPYGCWCDRCRSDFRKEHGIDMPAGVTWDDAWDRMLAFRCDSSARFCRALEAFVKARRPDISVDFNYHGSPPFSWETGQRPVRHAESGDFVTAEGLPFVFGHFNPSLLSLFMRAVRPDGPVQAVTSRSVYDYHDFTVRPTADLEWEVFTYLAHGAQCTIVDKANYDGTVDPVVYQRIGEIFGQARERRQYFGHVPVPEVGLYYSARTRDWFARTDPPQYMAAFWGAHKALVQSHIPMGFLMDESVSLERLRAFPVVYLPNVAILTPREVDLLERYVAAGGRLLATGLTGLCDRTGRLGDRSSLAGIIGARLVRCQAKYPDNYVRLPSALRKGEGRFLLDGIPADWPMLTWGPIAVFRPDGARAFGHLMVAHRTKDNPWSHRMSPAEIVGPAVLVHRHGKGEVVTVPCVPDAAWSGDYRMPEHRALIRNLVRRLHPEPVVRVDAPANVEIVVARDDPRRRLLVHLLCFSGPATSAGVAFPQGRRVLPPLMERAMTYTACIHVRDPFRNARAVGPGSEVAFTGRAITLVTSRVHDVLVIDT